MNKAVSIIIPCYNSSKYLPQCFLSLVRQSIGIQNLELIFIDDASTDEGATWSLLEEFETAFPDNIIIIQSGENMRQGGARNIGLSYATGEYIFFCDADDWLELNAIEHLYQAAIEHNADIVQYRQYSYISEDNIRPYQNPPEENLIVITSPEERKNMLDSEDITYGCTNKLYRHSLIQLANVQYAEHVVYEEPLFVYPLLFYATRFYILPEYLYYYRQNPNGTIYSTMNDMHTLRQHAQVQKQVYEFMKQTPYYDEFHEEIDYYTIHTFLYETVYFASIRGMTHIYPVFCTLKSFIQEHYDSFIQNSYLKSSSSSIYCQLMELCLKDDNENAFEQLYNTVFIRSSN